jgi:hypothetical protein
MARVRLRGLTAIDRRTAAARGLLAFRDDLVAALGGDATLSPQRRKLIDLAARAALFLDHVDGWLTGQESLVNKRSRSVIPALVQRQSIADHLARLLDKLGLDRVPKRVQTIDDLVRDIEHQKTTSAVNPGAAVLPPPDDVDRSSEGGSGDEETA